MSTLLSNTIKPASGDTVTFADCNVSVGGTLTSEDVTSVDSVGLITARSGIEVSGIVTATTYYGDGSNLTGVESGIVNFVASGNIDNGKTVIIKDDGTVGIVTQTPSDTPSAGDPSVFVETNLTYTSIAYVGSSKVVVAWQNAAGGATYGYGKVAVGEVSGDTITFGDPVIFEYAMTNWISVVYDSANDKVVVAYKDDDNSGAGTSRVGTVVGTAITFPSNAVVWDSASCDYISATYDSTNGKVMVAYRDDGGNNTYYGKVSVQTVNGDSITVGDEVTFNHAGTNYCGSTFDSTNGVVVIGYQDDGNSAKGYVVVGTSDAGAGITFGPAAEFNNGIATYPQPIHDPDNNKIVIAYTDDSSSPSGKGTVRVGSVTGTGSNATISFGGNKVAFYDEYTIPSISYDSANDKIVIGYAKNGGSWNGLAIVGNVVGTGFTWGTAIPFESGQTNDIVTTYDSVSEKVVFAYRDADNSHYGTAVSFNSLTPTTNLTAENYIGIAGEAIANGATGKVNVLGGVNSGQSGLTTAKTYYIGQTGILTTTADTPSVVAGTSISDTKLLVR